MLNWRAAANHFREGGSDRVLEVLCARGMLPGWVFYYYQAGILRLKGLNPKAIKTRASRYVYGLAAKRDAHELVVISGSTDVPSLQQSFESFFEKGNNCFVARKDGAIVGYVWTWHSLYTITNDHYQRRQFHLLLRPDQVVFGDGYIQAEHRLRGIFPELVRLAVECYPNDITFFTTVARLNDHSLKSHQRLGFELLLKVACRRFGVLPYFWTVSEPDGPVKWVGWNQPRIGLEALLSGPEQTVRPGQKDLAA